MKLISLIIRMMRMILVALAAALLALPALPMLFRLLTPLELWTNPFRPAVINWEASGEGWMMSQSHPMSGITEMQAKKSS